MGRSVHCLRYMSLVFSLWLHLPVLDVVVSRGIPTGNDSKALSLNVVEPDDAKRLCSLVPCQPDAALVQALDVWKHRLSGYQYRWSEGIPVSSLHQQACLRITDEIMCL